MPLFAYDGYVLAIVLKQFLWHNCAKAPAYLAMRRCMHRVYWDG
jgi:hypothetical protein